MSQPELINEVRRHRQRLHLSQQDLADLVGVSRQAIVGIEGGRQVPSTALGLRLARALRCGLEELFRLSASGDLSARLAPDGNGKETRAAGARVAIGMVDGKWVAHRLPMDGTATADGVVTDGFSGRTVTVRVLGAPDLLGGNFLVSGCAPILGMLTQLIGRRVPDARSTWLPRTSRQSLDLLESGLVHVAGVHLLGTDEGDDHESLIRSRFPGQEMLIVNLARWREGFVVPGGNPLGIRKAEDLLRPGLRFAFREEGAAARELTESLLAKAGADGEIRGPGAEGHAEVAQLVRCGAADVGVAIEGVALAAGLGFVPLTQERFDLVMPAPIARTATGARLIDTLDHRSFRTEMAHVPGYDTSLSGQVTTLEAA